jgi:hypothetical protein
MNKIGAGIIAFVAAWMIIPVIAGLFLGALRLVEMILQGQFNWTVLFVLSVGVGIIGGIYGGIKIWFRLSGNETQKGSGSFVWWVVAGVCVLAVIRFLF